MVDQQLQLTQPRLLGSRRVEQRLAQRGSGDGKRVDQVRLAPHPPATPLGGGQPGRHPHQPLPMLLQRPLQTARHVSAVLQRPQAPPANPLRPTGQAPRRRSSPVRRAAGQRHRQQQQRQSACARPPRSRSWSSPPYRWAEATGERTGLNRGKAAKLLSRSRSAWSRGRRRRHNTGKSAHERRSGIESAAATQSLCPTTDSTRRE